MTKQWFSYVTSQQLRDLLKICAEKVQFLFNGAMFTQLFGVAIGRPFFRYVDDTFVLRKIREQAIGFLETLSNNMQVNILRWKKRIKHQYTS